MTVFCAVWLGWNTLAPEEVQFDPRALNFTLLTLMLSLQASYSAPLILLAQDRQADRDRVAAEQDRSEEHTSELQSRGHLVCRLLLAKKNGPEDAADERPQAL